MRNRRFGRGVWGLSLGLALVACGSSDEGGSGSTDGGDGDGDETSGSGGQTGEGTGGAGQASICDAGETFPCACSEREVGIQVCAADGMSIGECGDCSADLPTSVRIEVREAVVIPVASQAEAWDGFDGPDPQVWDALLAATTGAVVPGAGNIANAVLDIGLSGIDAPDPVGVVRLIQPPLEDVELVLEEVSNDVHPIWSGKAFQGVSLSIDTVVEMTLEDADLTDNDNIGSLSITYPELVEAWLQGGGYWHESSEPLRDGIVAVKFAVISE